MIIPVPSDIASAVLELREKYISREITKEEYSQEFQRLQAQVYQDKNYPQVCLTGRGEQDTINLSEA